jgi:endoglucanase
MSIHVDGKNFKDGANNIVQLRGVNLMGMEFTAVGGWSPNDPYPQLVEANWAALHAWKVNIIRIPLNETSYLGLTCVNSNNLTENADPGGNYKSRLKQVVDRATSEGFYVILDLHLTAPDDALHMVNGVKVQCAEAQNPVADADHSVAFWTDLATAYKTYPNVLFELFNEPYINQWGGFSGNAWQALRDGAQLGAYVPQYTATTHMWQSAGMQAMLNAIRATGATNVILEGGLDYSASLDQWMTYKATDPLNQLAAVWHAYPAFGYAWGTDCYTHPGWCDDRAWTSADAILAANYPVIVTEFGDQNTAGTVGAPFVSALLPKLDSRGISYVGWTFTVSGEADNILIKDNNGTPTDGYGVYTKSHYLCRDAGTANCP